MKTFNNLTPPEVSKVHSMISVDHNLKVISTVYHSAVQSCNKRHVHLSMLSEKMFNILDDYIMNNFGDFDDNFFLHYKNEIHPSYENEAKDNISEDA